MTTKFLDNQICTFKILLSWRVPRKNKTKKNVFGRLSSLHPRPSPLKSANFIFIVVSPSLIFTDFSLDAAFCLWLRLGLFRGAKVYTPPPITPENAFLGRGRFWKRGAYKIPAAGVSKYTPSWAIPPVRLGLSGRNSGKIPEFLPETLSERFLEFPSRVRLGCPKPYNSRHLRLPERFQNSLPPQYGWGRLFFRNWFRRGPLGTGDGIPSSTGGISDLPLLSLSLKDAFWPKVGWEGGGMYMCMYIHIYVYMLASRWVGRMFHVYGLSNGTRPR